MRIAIVEDENAVAEQFQEYAARFMEESGHRIELTRYSSGIEFLKEFRGQYDIVMLDIVMPGIDGMETARRVRQTDPQVMLLFVTNMVQYAIRGYEVDAMDYILKPVNYFVFSQRLGRAIQRLDRQGKHYLMVTCKNGGRKLEIESIYYVESQGHNLLYHTADGVFTVPGTMKTAEEKLLPFHFFRCNKGYLVSLAHVDGITDGCALVAGEKLLISRARKNSFLEALTEYIGGVMV
ncbi:MAG: response regulator transcription factor [Oscillospiraceae bacterium]|nr:response regulator transcription factor [Oscillospiraceae bacterium]